jgi:hypothetical protein
MLRMKAWLETRWRLFFALAMGLVVLLTGQSGGGLHSTENARRIIAVISLVSIVFAINLAGDGIRTHPSFRKTKGLHGSLYFTLSLPVSRLRLLSVRAGIGLLESAGVTVVIYGLAWILFPLVRGDSTLIDLLELIVAAIVCSASFYFASVLLAIFLDDAWQIWGGILLFGAVQGLTVHFHLPASLNLTGFAGDSSPLLTHRLPWTAMAISVCVSILLFSVALKIVQVREY